MVLDVLMWAGVAVAAALGVGVLVACLRRRPRLAARGRPSAGRRRVGAFVTAVAGGDFARADREAERVLRLNDPGRTVPSGPRVHRLHAAPWRRSTPSHTGSPAGADASNPPLTLFDAHTVLVCDITDFTRIVDSPASLAKWFGVRRDADADTAIVAAGRRRLRLGGVVETWQPTAGALVTTAHGPDGSTIRSHVTFREAIVPHPAGARRGVEVWVHVELPADKASRKLLATLKPAVEAGLHRLEAEFNSS